MALAEWAALRGGKLELTHFELQTPTWTWPDILPPPDQEAHMAQETAAQLEAEALEGEVVELGWTGAKPFRVNSASLVETWRRTFQRKEEERIEVLFSRRQAPAVAAPENPPSKKAAGAICNHAEGSREAFASPLDCLRFSSRARVPVQRLADDLLQEQEARAAAQRLSAASKARLCLGNSEKKALDGPELEPERRRRLVIPGARHKALARAIAFHHKGPMQRCDRVKRFTTLISALEASGICEVERASGDVSLFNPTGIKTLILLNPAKFYEQVLPPSPAPLRPRSVLISVCAAGECRARGAVSTEEAWASR